jgi:YegS/Rv2252/BmrU family lipid kinase
MRRAKLLYNPSSGNRRHRRLADVEAAAAVLTAAGVETESEPTRQNGGTAEQVREALAKGFDTIFACGGDGTIHDVLQGLAGTEGVLGIVPLGTANAMAHDIRLPLSPDKAVRAVLQSKPRRIAIGKVEYQNENGQTDSKFFTVAVGVGADAHLFYQLNPAVKLRLGMMAYYARATKLWLTYPMEYFSVHMGTGKSRRDIAVSQMLAVRIRFFGGVLRELAPGASLDRPDVRIVLFRTQSRLRYLAYIIRGLCGGRWNVPGIELVYAAELMCATPPGGPRGPRLYVEADGELLGHLPARITMVPDALSVLVP